MSLFTFPIIFLCSDHRRWFQRASGSAEARAGSERSSFGSCLSYSVSSPFMAGLCGPRWLITCSRNCFNGRLASLTSSKHFCCICLISAVCDTDCVQDQFIQLQCHPYGSGRVQSVLFSPDSQTLLTVGLNDGSIFFCNLR